MLTNALPEKNQKYSPVKRLKGVPCLIAGDAVPGG